MTYSPMPKRQILIPIDGTPQSEYMLDWTVRLDPLGSSRLSLSPSLFRSFHALPSAAARSWKT